MKIKTSKSAAKRIVKVTKNGKILLNKMSAQHRNKGKSKKVKRESRKTFTMSKTDAKKVKRMIPYL